VPKQTGIGARLFVDEIDASGDTGAIDTIALRRAQLDYTGLDKEYMERLPGLGDAEIGFTGFFNRTNTHSQLSPIGTAAQIVTAALGATVGASAASISGAQVDYNVVRGPDGMLSTKASFTSFAGYGVEWGNLLTAGTVSATGTGSAYDGAAASTNGGAAYLHVFSVTAGTATVIVEDSANASSWATIATFTAASAGTAERQSIAGTIRQYTRYNISGGTAVIAVNLHRA
jgi:hypothetical protein